METLLSIIEWLFFDSVYGPIIFAGIIFLVAYLVKLIIPKFPNPIVIATLVFFIGLFTVPSIPRYQFSNNTMAQIEGKKWIRTIDKEYLRSVTEPLTWVNPPLGSIFIIMPYDPVMMGSFDFFQEVVLEYDKEPKIRIVERFCADKTIHISKYDQQGVLRAVTNMPKNMTEEEKRIYCEYDWSKETSALIDGMKKQYE